MAVRAGMQDLIDELRRRTSVTITEYTDQQLQDKLDQHKMEFREVALTATPTRTADSSTIYLIYDLPDFVGEWFELPIDNVINTYFYLTTSTYTPVVFGTAVEFDENLRRLTFAENTRGNFYYLTLQTYDLFGAAADIWQIKCDDSAKLVDIRTDNHTLALSQAADRICERYTWYASRSYKAMDTRISRSDQALQYGKQRVIRGFAPVEWWSVPR